MRANLLKNSLQIAHVNTRATWTFGEVIRFVLRLATNAARAPFLSVAWTYNYQGPDSDEREANRHHETEPGCKTQQGSVVQSLVLSVVYSGQCPALQLYLWVSFENISGRFLLHNL